MKASARVADAGAPHDAEYPRERFELLDRVGAFLAHELRNPLSAARLYLDLLVKETSTPKGRQVLGALQRTLEEMNDVIGNVLQLSGGVLKERSLVNLRSIFEELKLEYKLLMEKTTISVQCEGPSLVLGDESALRQVARNLLLNAVQAIGGVGSVVVNLSEADSTRCLRCTVKDSGPGISEDVLPRIFDPFETTKIGGSGLGLAVVAQILSAHNATFGAYNSDHGAVFWFEIEKVGA
jgi:signal transduction histidine kinase